MAVNATDRLPPVVFNPPKPLRTSPATLIFLHNYGNSASRFNADPPTHLSIAHHLHESPQLQHLKIIVPHALPSVHPTTKGHVWYNLDVPYPSAGDPEKADHIVEFGAANSNEDDIVVTMDYLERLINEEISAGTPTNRIIVMGYSQGATIAALFILTRKLAADLGAIISYAGFPPTPIKSVFRMQKENGLQGAWSKETKLFMLHGSADVFVPETVFRAWTRRLNEFRNEGKGISEIESKLIDGSGHWPIGLLWPDTISILEKVVPASRPCGEVLTKL